MGKTNDVNPTVASLRVGGPRPCAVSENGCGFGASWRVAASSSWHVYEARKGWHQLYQYISRLQRRMAACSMLREIYG